MEVPNILPGTSLNNIFTEVSIQRNNRDQMRISKSAFFIANKSLGLWQANLLLPICSTSLISGRKSPSKYSSSVNSSTILQNLLFLPPASFLTSYPHFVITSFSHHWSMVFRGLTEAPPPLVPISHLPALLILFEILSDLPTVLFYFLTFSSH